MKEISSWRLAAILTGIFGVIILLLLLLILEGSAAYSFGYALVCAIPFLFVSRYFLEHFLFQRIRLLSRSVEESLKQRKKIDRGTTPGITRLELAVQQLVQEKTSEIDHLKELERYRKEFLGDVAHELRSPIFNIVGYVDTLLDGAWKDPDVNVKFLTKAANNVDHLRTLVEDLVTISRIETGDLQLIKTNFDLLVLVEEVTGLLEFQAKDKKIGILIKTDSNHITVNADRQKVKQILTNLIGNSIKYGRDGGQTVVNLRGTVSHQRTTIEISDNGEGIAEEDLPRIFERFYRADKARSRKQPSTGLGLAIVKHFIEAHQQQIWVTSREGIGSIFSFTLAKA
ncbi:MAG: cell wall metabolism sensor histidine kinase WalK [Bacteroidota bacterium]|nr:cell wall metabolism sensor histidine kinase WalK [Bacteroidota bacterium]